MNLLHEVHRIYKFLPNYRGHDSDLTFTKAQNIGKILVDIFTKISIIKILHILII